MSKQSNALSQLEQVATYVKHLNYENRRLKLALDAKMLALYKDDTQAIIITEAPAELMIYSRTDGNHLYSYRKEMEEWAKKVGVKVFVVQEVVEAPESSDVIMTSRDDYGDGMLVCWFR